ncbi:hypothetical protein SDC9_182599 [bioreactor metagenome]|uniref:HTH crp-type domain-containing protein n=1 Tax=bioreactor metagenome TaxID=1076179 RepID=A0A645HG68_9ZZZZ
MAYFMMQMDAVKSTKFQIPFSRRELADYLCVERSAMSRELGRLKDDRLLDFHKNEFEILDLTAFSES